MSTVLPLARLEVDGAEVIEAVRPIVRASSRSAAAEVMLAFSEGVLEVEACGVSASLPATGTWGGVCTVHKSVLRLLASLPRATVTLTIPDQDHLRVGSTSLPARWRPTGGAPRLDLPLSADLRTLLRLRLAHSDEDLLTAGVLEAVERAERERDEMIREAARKLRALGDFTEAITTLVVRAVADRGREPAKAATVSREEARTIAERATAERALGVGVRDVFLVSEISRPPSLYGGPNLEECWIAYVDRGMPMRLSSSIVVLISIATGEVLYAGGANDEG